MLGIVASGYGNAPQPAAGFRASVLKRSPLFFWGLDDSSGIVVSDASGNGNVGTYGQSPAPSLAQSSIVSTETYSAQVSDRLWSGDNASPGTAGTFYALTAYTAWSIAGWFQRGSAAAMSLCGLASSKAYSPPSPHGTVLSVSSSGILSAWVYVPSVGQVITATGTTDVGTSRHHVAVEVDQSATGKKISIYLDGALEAQASLGGTAETFTAALHVGYSGNLSGDPIFAGKLQDCYGFGTLQGASAWAADFTAGK